MKRLMLVIGLAVTASAILIPSLAQAADPPKKLDVMLYVDTVNGSRPVGAKPRPVSCTQTNIYTRGEQQVFRVWGTVAGSGDILSTENVKYAYVTVPGTPEHEAELGLARLRHEQGLVLGSRLEPPGGLLRSARPPRRSSSRPRTTRSASTSTSTRSCRS